jgi:hypothetical protein
MACVPKEKEKSGKSSLGNGIIILIHNNNLSANPIDDLNDPKHAYFRIHDHI